MYGYGDAEPEEIHTETVDLVEVQACQIFFIPLFLD